MHPQIDAFLRSRLAEALRKGRDALLRTPYVSSYAAGVNAIDKAETSLALLRAMHTNHLDTLRTRDIRPAMPAAKRFAAEFDLPSDPDSLAELSLGLVQLARQVNEQKQLWLKEGIIDQIGPDCQLPVTLPAPPAAQSSSPLFSDVLKGFIEYMDSTKSWTGQTLAQNSTSFRMFVEVSGDHPVHTYAKQHTVAFYDLLRKLPKSYSRDPCWRGMSLCNIVAASEGLDVPRLTMKTVQRHFTALGRLFEYLRERGEYTGTNPAYGLTFPERFSFAGFPPGSAIPEWVERADTVEELAQKLDIDPEGLSKTKDLFNRFVDIGNDEDFGRGNELWKLAEDKHAAGKNPRLGALIKPPFYGIELHPSPAGSAGLDTNVNGQVMHLRRHPMPGLYASGNSTVHTETGLGYQPGMTIAAALTFSYLAVQHMATIEA